jgi:parvulin-like peptidyl-prolyl isomerase
MKKWYDDHMVQFKKEEADLAMIVVNTEEEANKAVAELDGGADFAIVATKYSIDPQTKATGGQMGSVDLRSMPPQMKMELDKVEDGKHSPAINMGSAFGILKVNKRTNTLTPLEEVKDQIKEDMLQEESQTLVKELRDAATVVTPEAAAPEAAVVVPSVDE